MRTFATFITLCLAIVSYANNEPLTANFTLGNPSIQSLNTITFGPQNILFVGDSKSAAIVAIDFSNHPKVDNSKVNLSKIDEKIAQTLGAAISDIEITDMAINTLSGNIYFAIQHNSGKSILLRLNGDTFETIPLDNVSFSSLALEKPISLEAKDRRGNSQRKWAISDVEYGDGHVMVSGLSTEEFGSTFRSIPFPFKAEQKFSALEIYHAAHGQYETQSPVKSFVTMNVNGKQSLVAGYTCTPLVVFPLESMEAGKLTKGRTVAELGNWNTPTDMITMEKGANQYVIIANTSRNVMKIKLSDIEKFQGSLSAPVTEPAGTDGIPFISLPFVQVQQLAKYSDDKFVMLQRNAKGELTLNVQGSNWL
jgi:hypothetical protein